LTYEGDLISGFERPDFGVTIFSEEESNVSVCKICGSQDEDELSTPDISSESHSQLQCGSFLMSFEEMIERWIAYPEGCRGTRALSSSAMSLRADDFAPSQTMMS